MAGTVSRERSSSSRSLRASARDVGEVAHASARRCGRERGDPLRLVGGDDERPLAGERRELGVEERRARLVEARVRLVEEQQVAGRGAASGRARAAAASRARTPTRARAAPPRGRSARAACRSARAARARGRAARRGRGSRARSARGRRAARAPDTRSRRARRRPRARPRVGASSPAQSASSVDFPEPFGPVTTRKSRSLTSRSRSRSTRFVPKRGSRPRARITRARPGGRTRRR